jgi:gamma-glutamylputrescine oxidase
VAGNAPAGGVEVEEVREPSFWTRDAPALPPCPRLSADLRLDVAIVGSGFTGLACACYLRRHARDLCVAVLEAQAPASGASSRNSGLFGPYYAGWRRHMLGDPALAERFRALGRRGYERLMAFLAEEDIDCDVLPGDTLLLADAAQAPALKAQGDGWAALGLEAEWIEGPALAAQIGTGFYAGACGLRRRWRLHPGKLIHGLLAAVRRADVPVFERSPVVAIDPGPPARLATPGGTVTAARVVLATNAYTPRLGLAGGMVIPVHHVVLASRPLTGDEIAARGLAAWPARLEVGLRTHTMRLTRDGRLSMRETLGYADQSSGIWPDLDAAYDAALASYAVRYPWVRELAIEHRWHCVSAHTENGHVVFGPLGADHILASAGYNGSGVVAAHYHGYLLARHLAGHTDDDYRLLCRLPRPRALDTEAERHAYIEEGIGV